MFIDYTLACRIFKISQFNIHKQSNITYFSIIFNTLHNYNYQDERTQGEQGIRANGPGFTLCHAGPSHCEIIYWFLDSSVDRIKHNLGNQSVSD